jgi:nitrate reductase NapE component
VSSARPAAAPARSGSSAIKIILIVVAIFVGLSIIGAGAFGFMVWRVARAVHVSGSGGQVTLQTSEGKVTANTSETFSASDLDTDIYPGAQSAKGSVRLSLPSGSMITAAYVTSDSKEQVIDFYKTRFGSNASVTDTGDGVILTLDKSEQESVMVTITAKSSQDGGKTQIHIVHTKNNKSS